MMLDILECLKENMDGLFFVRGGHLVSEIAEDLEIIISDLQNWNNLNNTEEILGYYHRILANTQELIDLLSL